MLERQYDRVIRWVRRAQTMSDGGKYSDAIMDVECARAELEGARQELLLCHSAGAERSALPVFWRALPAALCALLIMALPLGSEPVEMAARGGGASSLAVARDAVAAAKTGRREGAEQKSESPPGRYKEWLTSDEKQLLDSVRKGLGEQKRASRVPLPAEKRAEKSDQEVTLARSSLGRPVQDELSAEEMFRLMEVGRKALRKKNDTVVLEFN